jgi:molybdate transport system substrate-binding protein
VVLVGCESPKPVQPVEEKSGQNAQSQSTPIVMMSAAASTKEIMEQLAADFSAKANCEIKINPGPSSNLANQIIEGAQVDLFLSANRQWAQAVADAKRTTDSIELLTNELVIVVPKGNPAGVHAPQDLATDRVNKIALAGENVPAGKYADQALTTLGLLEQLTSARKVARAQDVRGALNFIDRREAEAGIVYSTDVALAKNVEQVYQFDPSNHDEIVYVLVLLKHGAQQREAQEFFAHLQSQAADQVYAQAGFRRWKPK